MDSETKVQIGLYAIILLLIFIPMCGKNCVKLATSETVTQVKVDKKEAVKDMAGYLIFTDKGVFSNTDSWINLKFNSSDVYNEIKEEKCYDMDVNLMRVPILSWYKNILSVKEVPCKVTPTVVE